MYVRENKFTWYGRRPGWLAVDSRDACRLFHALARETAGTRRCQMFRLAAMVSAPADWRPCRLKSIHQGQCPWEPLQYHQFVFARHSTRRGLPNPGFPPSAFSVSTYSKASPSPSIRLPHHPFPYSNNLTCLQFVVGLVIAKFRYAHARCLPGCKSSAGFRKVVP